MIEFTAKNQIVATAVDSIRLTRLVIGGESGGESIPVLLVTTDSHELAVEFSDAPEAFKAHDELQSAAGSELSASIGCKTVYVSGRV